MGVPPTHPKLRPFSAHSSVKRFGQISSAWARRRLMLPWRSHKGMIWNQSHKGLGYICIYIYMYIYIHTYVYINLYIYILLCWENLLGPISNIILPLAWYTWSWTQPLCQVAIGKTWDFQSSKKPCCSVHQPQPAPQTPNRSGPSFLSGDWSHLKNPNSPCYDRSSLATHGPHVAPYRSNIFGYPKGW